MPVLVAQLLMVLEEFAGKRADRDFVCYSQMYNLYQERGRTGGQDEETLAKTIRSTGRAAFQQHTD